MNEIDGKNFVEKRKDAEAESFTMLDADISNEFFSVGAEDIRRNIPNPSYTLGYSETQDLLKSYMESIRDIVVGMVNTNGVDIRYPTDDFIFAINSSQNGVYEHFLCRDLKLAKLSVLKIELRDGFKEEINSNIMENLSNENMTSLVHQKLQKCVSYIDKIKKRIADISSTVLVTGDVNSGKSSVINALIGRHLLPRDQQPCTTGFWEIIDAKANFGKEEVHAIKNPNIYDISDNSSYTCWSLDQLEKLDQSSAFLDYKLCKVYCANKDSKSSFILHNSEVDVKFIDSPGLNRDSAKTMAVVAMQEEIDAVVFVMNAENHFTQSGFEFITDTAKEKPLIFMAVNKFDIIEEKHKCREAVMKQIEAALPETYTAKEEYIHFLSANSHLESVISGRRDLDNLSFRNFESCLRSYLLEKRKRSKLYPASQFMINLSSDILIICLFNLHQFESELQEIDEKISGIEPLHLRLSKFRDEFSLNIETTQREQELTMNKHAMLVLEKFICVVGSLVQEVPYPGILRSWVYARAIVRHCNNKLSEKFSHLDKESQTMVLASIKSFYEQASCEIPEWESEYGPLDNILQRLPYRNFSSTFEDVYYSPENRTDFFIPVQADLSDFIELPPRNVLKVTIGIGISTVVSGSAFGFVKLVGGVYKVGKFLGIRTSNQWFWTIFTVAGIGTTVLVISDLENTLQRKISRKIRKQLRKSAAFKSHVDQITYRNRRAFDTASFELKKNVYHATDRVYAICVEEQRKRRNLEISRRFFERKASETRGLLDALSQLNFDQKDQPARIVHQIPHS